MSEALIASGVSIAVLMVLTWLVSLMVKDASIVSPIVMSVLLVRVSGAGLMEKTITDRKPEYADYIRTTNAFFPWPPAKG